MKAATLIYNPVAGNNPSRREKQIEEVRSILARASWSVSLARTSGPVMATDLARVAASAGADLIVVCGGDGTVNEVINGVALGNVGVAILPGGTANILAHELGLPRDPVRAACDLSDWRPRRIALGCATSVSGGREGSRLRYFLSIAGVGFDAYVVHQLSKRRRARGVLPYVREALRQVARYSFPRFVCAVDGRELVGTFGVVHRTSIYAGWFHLAPGASLFENRAMLCLFKSSSRSRYLLYGGAALLRQHSRLRDVELLTTQRIGCSPEESGTTVYFELDGELAGTLPATFEVVPDALTLLVP